MVEAATTRRTDAPASGRAPSPRRWWVTGARILAVAYAAALLAVIVAFRYLGERWWVTQVALYLPRAGFALPLPFVVLALLVARSYRWLLTQVVALALVLFPLMGLHLPGGRSPSAGAHRLRLFTFNIAEGGGARIADIVARARAGDPDLVVFQEADRVDHQPIRAGFPGFFFDETNQFVLASRFPIEERFFPPRLPAPEGKPARSRRFIRYRIATPGGAIHLYNVHPVSPREGLADLRGEGIRYEVTSGRIFRPPTAELNANTALRVAQIAAIAEDAAASPYPVLIAGDTNLPGLSWAFGHSLGRYHDAFAEVGSGFGYTFPASSSKHRPWLRIDRFLGDDRFRFLSAAVVPDRLSDHLALTADVELLPASR
jgi:endonuclease/exonuclease/phosphatase family metal-dependent hydrolase